MSKVAGRDPAYDLAIPQNGLVVIEQRFRILKPELQQSPLQPRVPLSAHGVAADELALVHVDRKSETRLEDVILIRDVMAEVTIRFFETAAIHRMQTAKLQAVVRTRLTECLEDVPGLVRGDINLPTQFADIRDAVGACEAPARFRFRACCEGMMARLKNRLG